MHRVEGEYKYQYSDTVQYANFEVSEVKGKVPTEIGQQFKVNLFGRVVTLTAAGFKPGVVLVAA